MDGVILKTRLYLLPAAKCGRVDPQKKIGSRSGVYVIAALIEAEDNYSGVSTSTERVVKNGERNQSLDWR